jgi:HEPN domain-containing protein
VPIATLNRKQLQEIAENRLRDAEILLKARQFTGAYYMAGLAMECGLKAYLASKVKEFDFPDKDFVFSAYTHNLEKLARLDTELWHDLQREIRIGISEPIGVS